MAKDAQAWKDKAAQTKKDEGAFKTKMEGVIKRLGELKAKIASGKTTEKDKAAA